MEDYEKEIEVGQGTYGVVYRATKKSTKEVVALKRIKMGNDKNGISFTAIREIKILGEINQENVIHLLDVFAYKTSVYLVFEFQEYDLEMVVKDRDLFLTAGDIKSYMLQLLRGVETLHKYWVLHRDLKPNNLLMSKDGILKIADFGFARQFGSPNPRYTHEVVTRWYRAPELLFGATQYGPSIDIWSVGCIFAELMMKTPYFAGDSDLDQLSKIFAALGTPTEETWPGMTSLPNYIQFNYCPGTPLKQLFTAAKDDAIDLLSQMIKFNPSSRITATEALKHPYFANTPLPTKPHELPKPSKPAKEIMRSPKRALSPSSNLKGKLFFWF